MKERPILFSAPMVRAILEGRKTQTRRVVKLKNGFARNGATIDALDQPSVAADASPYGKPGDRLWVRENFNVIVHSDMMDEDRVSVTYRADNKSALIQLDTDTEWEQAERLKKRDTVPSIHMPRWASRITLEITAVRVERLQDISEADALAEGAFLKKCPCSEVPKSVLGINFQQTGCHIHGTEFKHLWQSINGAESWDENPWVWVVEFKSITP